MPQHQPRRPSSAAAFRVEIAKHAFRQADVAERAALSFSTLSLILNGLRGMSTEQGERIGRAIESLKREREAAERARREFEAAATG